MSETAITGVVCKDLQSVATPQDPIPHLPTDSGSCEMDRTDSIHEHLIDIHLQPSDRLCDLPAEHSLEVDDATTGRGSGTPVSSVIGEKIQPSSPDGICQTTLA